MADCEATAPADGTATLRAGRVPREVVTPATLDGVELEIYR